MPIVPFEGMDPDEPGSRFTWRPALMVRRAVDPGALSSDEQGERGARSVVGDEVFGEDPDLGTPSLIRGSFGRGAEGFAEVLEWVGTAAGAGVVGGASWAATAALARAAKRIMSKISNKGEGLVYVSRGLAVLLAVDDVLRENPGARVVVEAADEPSAFAGYQTPELNYVAIEPWLVTLVDFDAKTRHVVVVRPTGAIAGRLSVPLEEYEEFYLPIPRLDEG